MNLFQNLSSLKKQVKKTDWSSAAPLKGEGIKLGLLHIFFFGSNAQDTKLGQRKMQEKLTEGHCLALDLKADKDF